MARSRKSDPEFDDLDERSLEKGLTDAEQETYAKKLAERGVTYDDGEV